MGEVSLEGGLGIRAELSIGKTVEQKGIAAGVYEKQVHGRRVKRTGLQPAPGSTFLNVKPGVRQIQEQWFKVKREGS